jgi:hypothetical protein
VVDGQPQSTAPVHSPGGVLCPIYIHTYIANMYYFTLTFHVSTHDYQYSWGYTIFRTSYAPGSDEAFANAIERLAVYAKPFTQDEHASPRVGQAPFDARQNEEL